MADNEIAKRRLVWAAVFIAAIPFGIVAYRVVAHRIETQRLDAAFEQIALGMTVDEVEALMGGVGRTRQTSTTLWWGDRPLADAATRVASEVWYSPPPFLFPLSFAIAYDEKGKVVGKHRYD